MTVTTVTSDDFAELSASLAYCRERIAFLEQREQTVAKMVRDHVWDLWTRHVEDPERDHTKLDNQYREDLIQRFYRELRKPQTFSENAPIHREVSR